MSELLFLFRNKPLINRLVFAFAAEQGWAISDDIEVTTSENPRIQELVRIAVRCIREIQHE